MAERTVVITGASSYTGNLVAAEIARRADLGAVAIHSSPRSRDASTAPADLRLVADLVQPLAEANRKVIADADLVIHLAWVRGIDRAAVEQANLAMIENLAAAMTRPERLVLISTGGAGADAPSTYGATKFAADRAVRARGGSVLSVGLIVGDPPRTAYRTIERMVCRLPLRIRFEKSFRFYAGTEQDFTAACLSLLDLPASEYAAFPPAGLDSKTFLSPIEQSCRRARLPIFIPGKLLLVITRLLAGARLLPGGIAERLLTFLYSDTDRLAKLTQLPR